MTTNLTDRSWLACLPPGDLVEIVARKSEEVEVLQRRIDEANARYQQARWAYTRKAHALRDVVLVLDHVVRCLPTSGLGVVEARNLLDRLDRLSKVAKWVADRD